MTMTPRRIILHCSDTEDGPGNSWPAIRGYHIAVNRWADIGYHYGLERIDGRIILQSGRAPWTEGAHCKAEGRNHDSLGLCVVGRYDEVAPDDELYDRTVQTLAELCFYFQIRHEAVSGHREYDPGKTCPGLTWDLDRLRADIGARLYRDPRPLKAHLMR